MLELNLSDLPETIHNIPSPPKRLYYRGDNLLEILKLPRVAIVGSRKITAYGRQVTQELSEHLAQQGVVIVSGLAYGVDAVAHEAAVKAGGRCIAVLPGPLDNILPTANRGLAERIIEQGGALVSEYPPGTRPQKQFFIARNRLMSGLADAVLITEAIEKSGALHTARFAIEQGRDILAVPGSIYSHASVGTNNLIKTLRAASVTSYKDVLECLGLNEHSVHAREVKGRNRNEQVILDLILQGSSEANDILDNSGLDVREFNTALTMLEIGGKIRALGANHWSLS